MLIKPHTSAIPGKAASTDVPLSQLPPGTICTVTAISGGNELVSRLACMGFTPGIEVILLQNIGRGLLIARVRETRLALGRGEAEKILVRPINT